VLNAKIIVTSQHDLQTYIADGTLQTVHCRRYIADGTLQTVHCRRYIADVH